MFSINTGLRHLAIQWAGENQSLFLPEPEERETPLDMTNFHGKTQRHQYILLSALEQNPSRALLCAHMHTHSLLPLLWAKAGQPVVSYENTSMETGVSSPYSHIRCREAATVWEKGVWELGRTLGSRLDPAVDCMMSANHLTGLRSSGI